MQYRARLGGAERGGKGLFINTTPVLLMRSRSSS
jgi:hypothetical protein